MCVCACYTHIKELLLRSVHVTYEKLSAKTGGYTHRQEISLPKKNFDL